MKNNQNPRRSSKKNIRSWLVPTIVLNTLLLIVVLGWFFMRGTSVTTGESTTTQTTDSITCLATNLSYPFFTYDNSDSKELKITAVFNGDIINSISLIYILYYSNSELVTSSDNINENSLGASSQKDGLSAKPLNAHFSKTTNTLAMSLYAKNAEITDISKKYLLLSDLADEYTKNDIIQAYTNQGFNCE